MFPTTPRQAVSHFEHDGPGNLSLQGPRHDNDHVHVRDIKLLPTLDETLCTTRAPWMPEKNVATHHHNEHGDARHIDTHFRLLRHDSIEKIRDINYRATQELLSAQSQTQVSGGETFIETTAGNRFFMYEHLRVEDIVSDRKQGLMLRMSFDCPSNLRGRELLKTTRLRRGMLCAIVRLEHDTNRISHQYFSIEERQTTFSFKSRYGYTHRAGVVLAQLPDAFEQDIRQTMTLAVHAHAHATIALVEYPSLLYQGFANPLRCLQRMSEQSYSFGKYISPRYETFANHSEPQLPVQPPSYCYEPDFKFNLQPLTQRSDSLFDLTDLVGHRSQDTLKHVRRHTTLDRGQAIALLCSLGREFAFTQGPPGCGKTFLGIALSRVLIASRQGERKRPLLLVCRTNHALDNFLAGLREAGVEKLMRVRQSSKEQWTKAINLTQLSRKFKNDQKERQDLIKISDEIDQNFLELDSWCKGLTGEMLHEYPCWQHVGPIVARESPLVYKQLLTNLTEPMAQAFTFDYWAKGGDLSMIEALVQQLGRRLYTCSIRRGEENLSAVTSEQNVDLQAKIEEVASFTRTQKSAAGAADVWCLPLTTRQALLRQWESKVDKSDTVTKLSTMHSKHKYLQASEKAVKQRKDIRVMQEQDVVGMTTNACAARWEMLQEVGFEIMICEEAGEVLEAHALCSLLPGLKHAIHIGDPLQLRPETDEQSLVMETVSGSKYRLNESLFERMMKPIDPISKTVATTQLSIQRRMHPQIAAITRVTYPSLQDHELTFSHAVPKGLGNHLWWLDHDIPEDTSTDISKSISNMHEAEILKQLVAYLLRGSDYSPGDIAVLTPYSGQLIQLRELLSQVCSVWLNEEDKDVLVDNADRTEAHQEMGKLEIPMANMIRLATIDNFQGEEAKVIILSPVRSGDKLGFVKSPNRINVACSRARNGFYVVGNSQALQVDQVWKRIIEIFHYYQALSQSIRLQCDRHPEHYRLAATAVDIAAFPKCHIPCNAEVECGHICPELCHDPSLHQIIPCKQPCIKVHACGHKCPKSCFEDCGSCLRQRRYYQPSCGHLGQITCSGQIVPCDHFEGYLDLSCGRHAVSHLCGDDSKTMICDAVCGLSLPCGHPCVELCGQCHESGVHCEDNSMESMPECAARCDRPLLCGHNCHSKCHDGDCPTCDHICTSTCSHSTLTWKCNESPQLCLEIVTSEVHGTKHGRLCASKSTQLQHQDILPGIQKELQKRLGHLRKTIDSRKLTLERTAPLFVMRTLQNRALAASKNVELILARQDELLALETSIRKCQTCIRVLESESSSKPKPSKPSTDPPSTHNPTNQPTTPWSLHHIQTRFIHLSLHAATARMQDTLTIAKYLLLEADDPSRQMARLGRELLTFARDDLAALLGRVDGDLDGNARRQIAGALEEVRKMAAEIERLLKGC